MAVTDLSAEASSITPSAVPRPRVAVVGSGFMGRVHAEAARRAGAEIVGAVGSSAERAAGAAEAVGAAQGYSDLHAMLTDAAPDVVHVCTPNAVHAAAAEAALAAGAHVICEKPLATSAGDAARLAAAALDGGRVATVPFVYRFHPMAREMRARIAAGEPGAVSVVHGGYLQDWLSRPEDDNWRVNAAVGGLSRAFADIGSHWCDFLEFVLGERILALSAQSATVRERRGDAAVSTEDLVTLHLRTTSGVLGTGVVCQVAAGRKNRLHLEVSGTDASLGFDQELPEQLWVGRRDGSTLLVRDPETLSPQALRYSRLPAGHAQGYQDCFDAFIADTYAAVRGEPVPDGLPTFADGLRAARLTEAVLTSAAAGGQWTEVPA
ncbi:Gfo/Idh/MocA family protein [Amycolatopsis sp. 195334CR]|uniref:Gfo/Idh/MocA family protein n=1 Tax=Amycolatopsis sp. 195334CR TaxID=2814588 RepID=UPI001A8EFA32|nr:Gfo/Idh/MocA family oxidoreductase [Amycolatopsis sp. 195334CR]MBN6037405.1 Gfo/Idh/MocA family oxidoreductase [Amycolatopsis sp. 195334CR]